MTARNIVFQSIRTALAVTSSETSRREAVAERLRHHPAGTIPQRGQLPPEERLALFTRMLGVADGSFVKVANAGEVPAAVADFLRRHNLPLAVRRGDDARLAALSWQREPALDVTTGPSDGSQLASLSHAFGAVAETGTLVLTSGRDNPTTLNFLPDNHIVVLDAGAIEGDYEGVLARLRDIFGVGAMPRAVNMITGPSRSADIEQTLILGAHGPRRLHVIVVGAP